MSDNKERAREATKVLADHYEIFEIAKTLEINSSYQLICALLSHARGKGYGADTDAGKGYGDQKLEDIHGDQNDVFMQLAAHSTPEVNLALFALHKYFQNNLDATRIVVEKENLYREDAQYTAQQQQRAQEQFTQTYKVFQLRQDLKGNVENIETYNEAQDQVVEIPDEEIHDHYLEVLDEGELRIESPFIWVSADTTQPAILIFDIFTPLEQGWQVVIDTYAPEAKDGDFLQRSVHGIDRTKPFHSSRDLIYEANQSRVSVQVRLDDKSSEQRLVVTLRKPSSQTSISKTLDVSSIDRITIPSLSMNAEKASATKERFSDMSSLDALETLSRYPGLEQAIKDTDDAIGEDFGKVVKVLQAMLENDKIMSKAPLKPFAHKQVLIAFHRLQRSEPTATLTEIFAAVEKFKENQPRRMAEIKANESARRAARLASYEKPVATPQVAEPEVVETGPFTSPYVKKALQHLNKKAGFAEAVRNVNGAVGEDPESLLTVLKALYVNPEAHSHNPTLAPYATLNILADLMVIRFHEPTATVSDILGALEGYAKKTVKVQV